MSKSDYQNRSFRGLKPIFLKEFIHLFRSPLVLRVVVIAPIIEMLLIGFAIEINVRQIRTVVYDLANTQESRQLIDNFINTSDFKIIKRVYSDQEMNDMIIAGDAKVGIKIPVDYSRHLLEGTTANVLVVEI